MRAVSCRSGVDSPSLASSAASSSGNRASPGSSSYLLELTARGACKGDMVRRLADMLHIAPRNLYCVGDHANDIGMLMASAIPFAPENAIESVRRVPGVHILPDARKGAVAALIRELDARY